MTVKPKPPSKTTKAAPVSKKSNLASKDHEALLQWLIEDQENICDALFGKNIDWFQKTVSSAIKKFRDANDSLLKSLVRGFEDQSLPPDYRSACGAKLKWAKAFLTRVGEPSPPVYESTSRPIVKEWGAQARIFTKQDYVNGRTIYPKPAGFIDLQVLLAIPNEFEVRCFDKPDSDFGTRHHASSSDAIEEVTTLKIFEPVWSYSNWDGVKYHRAWFDVWAELPPIGELLQYLKILSDLNCEYRLGDQGSTKRVSTSTVLVVPALSESLQAIIEHERFEVLSKDRYESPSED